ncbi:MAG: DUF2927 domain-containing protein [Leptolyngbyaceae cyanobacterium]
MTMTSGIVAATLLASNLIGFELSGSKPIEIDSNMVQGHSSITSQVTLAPKLSPTFQLTKQTGGQTGFLITRTPGSTVNLRYSPTTQADILGQATDGDRVTIYKELEGTDDDYPWYMVFVPAVNEYAWVRGDFVADQNRQPLYNPVPDASVSSAGATLVANVEQPPLANLATNTSVISTGAVGDGGMAENMEDNVGYTQAVAISVQEEIPQTIPPPPRLASQSFSNDAINYFTEVALGEEFGNASRVVRRWEEDIRIQVHDNHISRVDRDTILEVVNELNELIEESGNDRVNIEVMDAGDTRQANVDVHFMPAREFSRYSSSASPGTTGLFETLWNQENNIYLARILVSSTESAASRKHIIREELTQILGLMRDSFTHPDSIFYQNWSDTTEFSNIDEALIRMLYGQQIQPGMNQQQVRSAFSSGI